MIKIISSAEFIEKLTEEVLIYGRNKDTSEMSALILDSVTFADLHSVITSKLSDITEFRIFLSHMYESITDRLGITFSTNTVAWLAQEIVNIVPVNNNNYI